METGHLYTMIKQYDEHLTSLETLLASERLLEKGRLALPKQETRTANETAASLKKQLSTQVNANKDLNRELPKCRRQLEQSEDAHKANETKLGTANATIEKLRKSKLLASMRLNCKGKSS